MKYSRKDLEHNTKEDNFGSKQHKLIIQDLFDRASKGEPLSIAEADKFCRFIEVSRPVNPEEDRFFDVIDFPCCSDYRFKKLYLTYYHDLSGTRPASDLFGLIPISRRFSETHRLQEIHNEWHPNISKFNHKDQLLNHVASEANKELKGLKKLRAKMSWGHNLYEGKIKGVSLHSKYIYLTVKQFFEETKTTSILAELNGKNIEIDQKSMVHIMYRHYAGAAKQFDTGKSFHLDPSINHFDLPLELGNIIEKIEASGFLTPDQSEFIPVRINGTIYAIWLKVNIESRKGKGRVKFQRLETFYPIEEPKDLAKVVKEYEEKKIDESLSVFVKL